MKILIATPMYPPNIGGPATYSKLIFEEFSKIGTEVKIVSLDSFVKYPKIIRHFLFFIKILINLIKCDLVLAQDTVSVGFPTMLSAKILNKIFLVRVPGDYAWEQSVQRFNVRDSIDTFQNKKYGFRVEFLRCIQKIVVKKADIVITPSDYFKELVSKWGTNINPKRIYNGVEDFDVLLSEDKKNKIKKNLGIKEDEFVLISIGRLVPWKGFDTLISMMDMFTDENKTKLIIVGDGPDFKRLEYLVKEKKLEDKVIFTGILNRQKMYECLLISDIFVLNTSFESFSFQVVEAMKAKLPILSTKVGSLPELVLEGENGFLVDYNNKNQIFQKINLLRDDKKRKEFGDKSFIRSFDFSISNTINQLKKIIDEIILKKT